MTSIDTALDEAARGPRKSGLLSAIGGPQFIIAQLFTIFATILGVYYAGYVGFQRTLEYDRFVKAQEQTNILRSLHAELKYNTERLREFVPLLERTMEGHGVYQSWPKLHLFLWEASAQNPSVFAAPSQTLADMQAFYERVGDMLGDTNMHEQFRRLSTTNMAERKNFTEEFDAQVKTAETSLLSALQDAAAAREGLVAKYTEQ